jgi:hypothetical protein
MGQQKRRTVIRVDHSIDVVAQHLLQGSLRFGQLPDQATNGLVVPMLPDLYHKLGVFFPVDHGASDCSASSP